MKRARISFRTLLCVALGVLCLHCAASVGKSDDATSNAQGGVQGAWRWLDADARIATPSSLESSLFATPFLSRPEDAPDFVPSRLGAFALEAFPSVADDDDLFLTVAPTEPVPSVEYVSNGAFETIYRGAALSSLAIEPYGRRFFAYGLGAFGEQSAQNAGADKPGFNVDSWGGAFGNDWNLFGHGIVGYGLQGNSTNIKPRSGGVYKAYLNTFAGYLHFSVFDALWRVDASLGWAKSWEIQRRLSEFSFNSFTTSQWLFDLEFGARIDKGYTRIEPIVNMRVLNLTEPKKAEKYLTSTIHASDFSDSSYRLKVGSRFSWEHETVLATLKPYLVATWSREFGSRDIYTIGDATPFPIAYRYGAHRMPRNRLDLGGGLEAAMKRTLDLYLQYDVEFARDYASYLFFVGFNKKY